MKVDNRKVITGRNIARLITGRNSEDKIWYWGCQDSGYHEVD